MAQDRNDPRGSEAAATPEDAPTLAPSGDVQTHQRIGPYRLLEKLGEGGMGEVWLAEQREPVWRRVALKIIKHGMDTRRVVARFEAERQALALMDHPCVAKVYDAGSTPRGRPYFVMEYVDGVSITAHCDNERLTIRERLELFVQVCEGVQHAHHKAIIHRDLKPSNVMVSVRSGRSIPKIIDFGLAKAMSRPLTERTMHTEAGALLGTPEYMSPEQATSGGLNVDTRTDVYSLGMMLYALLVGDLPFDPRQLRQSGREEVRRLISHQDLPRPSARLSVLGSRSDETARRRRVDPTTLRRQLRSDLDWIVMRALEKDRARRYGSPQELAADIQRYLASRPVLAGPPTAGYRLRKFVRRHSFGVTVAGVLAVALAAGITGTVWQAVRATRAEALARSEASNARIQAATAEQTARFLRGMLESVQPDIAKGLDTTLLRQILESAAGRVDTELREQPEVRAAVFGTIGRTYRQLARYDDAERFLRAALDTLVSVHGEDHPDVAYRIAELGSLMRETGRLREAESMHRKALDIRRRLLPPNDRRLAESLNNLGLVLWEAGRPGEAEPLFREALEIFETVLGDSGETADTLNNLSLVVRDLGRLEEAEPLAIRSLEMWRSVGGDDSTAVAVGLNTIGRLLVARGKLDEAVEYYTESLELRKKLYGEEHPRIALATHNLGDTLRRAGRLEEAEAMLRESLDLHRKTLPQGHPNLAWPLTSLAKVLVDLGRAAEAEPLLREAVDLRRRDLPPGDWRTGASESGLGECLLAQQRYADAAPLLESAYDALEDEPAHTELAEETRRDLVRLYEAWGKPEQAARYRNLEPAAHESL